MNSLGRFGGRSALPGGRARIAGLVGVMLLAFGSVAGVANAGSSTRNAGVQQLSAAQDQYGSPGVLTPPSTTTTPTTPAPAAATKTVTTPATTPTTTPTTTPAAPAATTATTPSTAPATTGSALPFTGLSILKVMLVGGGLILLGFVLHRRRRNVADGEI